MTHLAPPPLNLMPPRHWFAQLDLQLERRGAKSVLSHVRHQGPLRVQRPFYPEENGCCHVYLLHPPGGMVLGDLLQINIAAAPGATGLITTPSAGKIYRAQGFQEVQRQEVHISSASGSCIEWLPQETIVFNGANGRLRTRLELQGDARTCVWDVVCLGRPASDEVFTEGRCEQILEIYRDDRPLLIERNRFDGGDERMQARWGLHNAPVAGTFLATLKPTRDRVDALVEALEALAPAPDHQWGLTQKGELFIARYLGQSTRLCRAGFEYVWRELRMDLTGAQAVAPRIWNT
jgi:urease accessory protein